MNENNLEKPVEMSSIERECSSCRQVVEIHGPQKLIEEEVRKENPEPFVCRGCQMETAGITAKIVAQEKKRRTSLIEQGNVK